MKQLNTADMKLLAEKALDAETNDEVIALVESAID